MKEEEDEAQQLADDLASLRLGQSAKPRQKKVYTRKNRKKGHVGATSGDQSHHAQHNVFQPEDERLLTSAFADRGRVGNGEVLITKFNIPITRRDIRLLLPDEWLNDELINFYMNLLQEHCEQRYSEWAQSNTAEPSSAEDALQEGNDTEGAPPPALAQQRPLRCHFFNTFFYALLVKGGHARVARWTRNVDLFASSTSSTSSSSSSTAEDEKDKKASSGVDLVIIPVHVHGAHWALATASPPSRTLAYYDSLQHPNSACVAHLRAYLLEEEKKQKKKLQPAEVDVKEEDDDEDEDEDEREWKLENRVEECPRQTNGSDCGVFTCAFARCCAFGQPMGRLHQRDMPRYRRLIALEILTGRLRPDLD